MRQPPKRTTLVLCPIKDGTLEHVRPFAKPGTIVAIGPGSAVIEVSCLDDGLQRADQLEEQLLGLNTIAVDRPGADAHERGEELLLAVERAARRVIRRELTTGGLIQRLVAQEVGHD